jgi:hypothetical protein
MLRIKEVWRVKKDFNSQNIHEDEYHMPLENLLIGLSYKIPISFFVCKVGDEVRFNIGTWSDISKAEADYNIRIVESALRGTFSAIELEAVRVEPLMGMRFVLECFF